MARLSKANSMSRPLPEETLKAHVAATIRLGKRLMELRAASRNAETALLGVTTRKCSECTATWTKHERAARWHVRCTFDDCPSGGSRHHVSDVPSHKVAALQPAARGKRREVGSQLRGQP